MCYNPEKCDLGFVKLMIEKLEGPTFNLKLYVPWRNDLPGSSKYIIDAKLIQDRSVLEMFCSCTENYFSHRTEEKKNNISFNAK